MTTDPAYILGHTDHELERLLLQASLLRPTTQRLLQAAGIKPGMRVLDVGSGAGDVALLAAEMVGTNGSVVGLDSSEVAVAFSSKRTSDAGLTNVRFQCTRAEAYDDPGPFDAVVGRYVLLFQVDPVAFVRSLRAKMTAGSIIAFHEIDDATNFTASPDIPRLREVNTRVFDKIRSKLAHHDVASRLHRVFKDAGLPAPHLSCERIVAGGAPNPIARWLALTHVTTFADDTGGQESFDAVQLLRDIDDAIDVKASQVASPDQWCAWARLA